MGDRSYDYGRRGFDKVSGQHKGSNLLNQSSVASNLGKRGESWPAVQARGPMKCVSGEMSELVF